MNVFDLVAKVSLDSSDVEKKLPSVGNALKKGLATAAKAGAAALGAASTALTFLTKSAVKAYGEFEQLEGGVKKIFGDDAAKLVMQNAEMAFKTAGLSANQYMETITGFSASLLQSLGGDSAEAARIADVAIRDMSDNANTFGTDISSIQAAYQGFAKQNYTMLDNLKLGYGGTKTEMERLIKDASQLTDVQAELGLTVDASSLSFDNIVKAISVMQKQMQIAGTTEAEAAKTIEGSINMTKAAWLNFLAALGRGEGVKEAMDNLTSSAKNVVRNVMPVVKRVLTGVAGAIKEIGPMIVQNLPDLVNELLPALLDAAATLVAEVIKTIPALLQSLYKVFDRFLNTFSKWLEKKSPKLAEAFNKFRDSAKSAFKSIATAWETTLKPKIGEIISNVSSISERITPALGAIKSYINDQLVPAVKEAWENNVQPVTESVSASVERIRSAWERITTVLQPVIDKVVELKDKFVEYITNGDAATDTTNFAVEAVNLFSDAVVKVAEFVANAAEKIATFAENIGPAFESAKQKAAEMKDSVIRSFNNMKSNVITTVNTVKSNVVTAWNTAKSTVAETVDGLKADLSTAWENITSTASTMWENVKNAIIRPVEEARATVSGIIDKIKSLFSSEIRLNIKLPHISWSTKTVSILGKSLEIPDFSVSWYKKAYDNPYMFTKPTLYGFGDGNGGEMVYGHQNLMNDIRAAVGGSSIEERLDEVIDLLEDIVSNGLNANISKTQLFKTMSDENRKRTKATNYNAFAMA